MFSQRGILLFISLLYTSTNFSEYCEFLPRIFRRDFFKKKLTFQLRAKLKQTFERSISMEKSRWELMLIRQNIRVLDRWFSVLLCIQEGFPLEQYLP